MIKKSESKIMMMTKLNTQNKSCKTCQKACDPSPKEGFVTEGGTVIKKTAVKKMKASTERNST